MKKNKREKSQRDLESEREQLLALMNASIPANLLEQIYFAASLGEQSRAKPVKISHIGASDADEE